MAAEEKNSGLKNRLVGIVIIIAALIISYNIFKKQSSELVGLGEQKEKEIKKSQAIEEIYKLERKLGSYRRFYTKKDPGSVLNTLGSIAKECNVNILYIRPEQEQKVLDYNKSRFVLGFSAEDYHTLGKFISRIESYKDIYLVESLDLKRVSQGRELSGDLRISAVSLTE